MLSTTLVYVRLEILIATQPTICQRQRAGHPVLASSLFKNPVDQFVLRRLTEFSEILFALLTHVLPSGGIRLHEYYNQKIASPFPF